VLEAGPLFEELQNLSRLAHEWLGFVEAVSVLQERGEIVESCGNVRVFCAACGTGYGEGLAHERLGLLEAVGVVQNLGEVVEVDGDSRVLVTECGAVDVEGSAHEWLGLVEAIGLV
jgi:hypothetical protein